MFKTKEEKILLKFFETKTFLLLLFAREAEGKLTKKIYAQKQDKEEVEKSCRKA